MSSTSRIIAGFVLVGAAVMCVFWLPNSGPTSDPDGSTTDDGATSEIADVDTGELQAAVTEFCGACHAVPSPDTFPREAWYAEVEQGYRFYYDSQRTDLKPPPMNQVVAYYQALAPEELDVADTVTSVDDSGRFSREEVPLAPSAQFPAVSFIGGDTDHGVLFCDMRVGAVASVTHGPAGLVQAGLGGVSNPAHVERCDLDADGRTDYVVAELGSFLPEDHDRGRVVWLRPADESEDDKPEVLARGLGRVADVRPGDFDADGDLDLVVGEFGWRTTGRILLLEQTDIVDGVPQFKQHVVDNRHGTIHVPTCDLDGDGRLDFVALVSQEYEQVDVFLNRGNLSFDRQTIFAAGDPSFGSSGIELCDLDRDGDLDVIYTNGDSLDSHYLKPYHAIHWLENRGGFPFEHHHVADFPGASRALPADVDGDGDIDIVATAYLPETIVKKWSHGEYDTLIWLEHTEPGQFIVRRLERGIAGHLSLACGDFDRDGDVDILTGHHGQSDAANPPWVTAWWNSGGSDSR